MILSFKTMRWLAGMAAIGVLALSHAPSFAYPVEVQSCFDKVTFDAPPKRPVVNDFNMVQTVLDMGLIDRFVGVAGIGGVKKGVDDPEGALAARPQFSERYPTMEAILGQDADFYFAGWQYGFSEATGVTPQKLADLGVKTYVLYESCIRIGPRPPVSMDTMYADVLALGRIFNVEDKAEAMVADFRKRVAAVTERTAKAERRPRIMYCGDCNSDTPPRSIGAEGMPRHLFNLAGGENIFDDIKDSYVPVSWDAVVERDPEWIVISNPRIPPEQSIAYLTSAPALRNVSAVKNRNFFVMSYQERSPSTRNVQALERLARAVHPELFDD
ncbi:MULTISPECIES: ABC transporter substrate-binding protein [unclassified Chelatococcus]|uniref:ABC transporter substrate-binding protein n=1 Tax=unclassified Chelatococcus TaxID=2638111 RepID=UPI001BD1126E|nr:MULTISPECIES: ABC transporter substrate-binding protein [unclassified Chelatococcus]MBS7700503.1 ABC transporter substrate-binding protein [Chelatococcus sp. YT9]MBX3556299.1 ABC transporter substrate-binding protein [Chelatococcus sp.]